jgi:hypothetical protein
VFYLSLPHLTYTHKNTPNPFFLPELEGFSISTRSGDFLTADLLSSPWFEIIPCAHTSNIYAPYADEAFGNRKYAFPPQQSMD